MTKYMISREPSSLAEVIERITAHEDLSLNRRQDLSSAVRRFCQLVGLPPDAIAAEPAAVRRYLNEISPAAGGMTKARWLNVRSLVGKALDLAGAVSRPGRPGKFL